MENYIKVSLVNRKKLAVKIHSDPQIYFYTKFEIISLLCYPKDHLNGEEKLKIYETPVIL